MEITPNRFYENLNTHKGYGNDSSILGPQGHIPMLYAPQKA